MIPISTTSTSDITEITSTDCVRSDGMMEITITNTNMYNYDYDIWVASIYKEKQFVEKSLWNIPRKIEMPKNFVKTYSNYHNRNSLPIKFRND